MRHGRTIRPRCAGLKIALAVALVVFVGGCAAGGPAAYVAENYPLADVRPSRYQSGDEAKVYQLKGTVSQETENLARLFPPREKTQSNDERMVLVYQNQTVDVYRQDGKTMAEVASLQYVRDHYDGGDFFRGYLTASIIRDIFSGPRSFGWGGYPTFSGRGAVPSPGKTVRQGSVGGPRVTGGGIFAGK